MNSNAFDATPYLDYLQMPHSHPYHMVPCEICASEDFTVLRQSVSWNNRVYGILPVQACNRCGFIMQNPRFDAPFYAEYYGRSYRQVTKGSTIPKQEFIDDQIIRGRLLYEYLCPYFDRPGRIADIGCSVGGMLIPFKRHGWEVWGCDPDQGFVEFGKNQLGLEVEYLNAEDMRLSKGRFDLIIIMGSLEHVFDPNQVLAACRHGSRDGALLLLEGRGEPRGHSRDFFNHSHHRYLTFTSMELFMIKHGWEPILRSAERVTGPSRPTNIYTLGRAGSVPSPQALLGIIGGGKREHAPDLLARFDAIDARIANSPTANQPASKP